MRKVIILLICLLLLSGCSATYDLYVGSMLSDEIFLYDDNDVLETSDNYDMEKGTENYIENYAYQVNLFDSNFDYDREQYSNDKVSGYIYNYTYSYKNFSKKSMVYNCYDEINVDRGDNIVIKTSNEFKCFDKYSLLNDVTVNIHYSGKVIKNNADSVEDGVYTWNINKDNYANKPIYFEAVKFKKNHTFEYIAGGVFLVLVIISLLLIFKINKKTV